MGELAEMKRIIDRTILVRRVTLGIFSLIALIVVLSSEISPLNPLFSIPFLWLLLTVPFQALVHRQRSLRTLQWVHAGFFAVEVLLIAFLIHRMGGVEWIGVIFYLFTVMYANFFLPKFQGYLVTGIAVGSYVAVALLELFGVIPHVPLFRLQGPPHRSLSYVLATVLVGGIGIYAALAFTVRAFADLFHGKNRELQRERRKLEELSLKLLSAHEEERRRLSRMLHDELGQLLVAARWALRAGKLRETEKLLTQAVEGTRRLARDLRPPLLDELGLKPALEQLFQRFSASTGIRVRCRLPEGRLPVEVETAVYRLVQEALENVRRHAQAREVEVVLERSGRSLKGRIRDDGVGFRPGRVEGLGIPGMREWVNLVGGEFELRSSPGRGTEISFAIPLPR